MTRVWYHRSDAIGSEILINLSANSSTSSGKYRHSPCTSLKVLWMLYYFYYYYYLFIFNLFSSNFCLYHLQECVLVSPSFAFVVSIWNPKKKRYFKVIFQSAELISSGKLFTTWRPWPLSPVVVSPTLQHDKILLPCCLLVEINEGHKCLSVAGSKTIFRFIHEHTRSRCRYFETREIRSSLSLTF